MMCQDLTLLHLADQHMKCARAYGLAENVEKQVAHLESAYRLVRKSGEDISALVTELASAYSVYAQCHKAPCISLTPLRRSDTPEEALNLINDHITELQLLDERTPQDRIQEAEVRRSGVAVRFALTVLDRCSIFT